MHRVLNEYFTPCTYTTRRIRCTREGRPPGTEDKFLGESFLYAMIFSGSVGTTTIKIVVRSRNPDASKQNQYNLYWLLTKYSQTSSFMVPIIICFEKKKYRIYGVSNECLFNVRHIYNYRIDL